MNRTMSLQIDTSLRLPKEEISKLLRDHSLEDVRHIKSISKGIESSTYSIITKNHSYILTLYEESPHHLSLAKEASLYFTKKGFPFAEILAIGTIFEKTATITTHLSGKVKSTWTEIDYETLGFLLGNFHKLSSSFFDSNPFVSSSLPFIWQLSKLFFEIAPLVPKEFLKLESEILFLEQEWPSNLHKGIIHGDLWPKHILFTNETISGILDFNPSYDPFILDLANLLKGIPVEKSSLHSALLSGYELIRPLSSDEYESLPLLIQAKIVATSLYLLKKAIEYPNRKDEFQTYAFLGLLKLDSF